MQLAESILQRWLRSIHAHRNVHSNHARLQGADSPLKKAIDFSRVFAKITWSAIHVQIALITWLTCVRWDMIKKNGSVFTQQMWTILQEFDFCNLCNVIPKQLILLNQIKIYIDSTTRKNMKNFFHILQSYFV